MKFREVKLRRDPRCRWREAPTIRNWSLPGFLRGGAGPASRQGRQASTGRGLGAGLKRALDDPRLGIRVLDVREPDEQRIARIAGVPLLPLSQLAQRVGELDRRSLIIFTAKPEAALCGRYSSSNSTVSPRSRASGGITAWAEQIDLCCQY